MLKRLLADLLLLLSIIIMPWSISSAIIIIFIILFHNYYESLIAGLSIDILYSVSGNGIFSHIFTILTIFIFFIIEMILKPKLRFYRDV